MILEMYNKDTLDDSDAYEKWFENENKYFIVLLSFFILFFSNLAEHAAYTL